MNTLSVCCPVYSEPVFMKIWLESVLGYADEVLIANGCGDSVTTQILEEYKQKDNRINVITQPQSGQPYSSDWRENIVRNNLVLSAKSKFVLMLDADEIMSDDFDKHNLEYGYFYGFKFIPFWRDIKTVRVNTSIDPHWYGEYIYRLFQRGTGYYTSQPHHCVLKSSTKLKPVEIKIFHIHYAMETFGNKRKPRDNRSMEMGPENAIDWEYGNKHPEIFGKEWSVKLQPYTEEYPKILQGYL